MSSAAAQASVRASPTPGAGSRRVLYVAIAVDVAMAVAKFFVAALTGSSAMLTEGVHSLVDIGNQLLLLFGVRRGQRAVDEQHPFGYGKTTYLWSLVVALSVFSVGGGVSVYEGIIGLTGSPVLTDPTWSYVVLGVAAVLESGSWWVSQQELNRHRRVGDSLWRASQRDMDVLGFTVFVVNSASLIGIAIAALGVWLGHALNTPYLDPVAAVLIGLVLIASAALLARKSVSLLVGVSLDRDQLAQLRKILTADPAVERVGRLLTMRLGPDSVLLTAAVRFARRLNLDEVEQAIERLERAIKVSCPSILHLYLESGALKQAARAAGQAQPAIQP
ncbi:cation diffusion facilitator family transporter [uncultured Thiodictyon sp.]|uniref:cation diffusion facilitator family transporter n=1 Tax=uncultured Thiodictyon sp. TaxID=1846217 RepID=UPI0025EBBABB|nr:cation diffusion facilitator family transporter [uncultured Thiodictyon sp.]